MKKNVLREYLKKRAYKKHVADFKVLDKEEMQEAKAEVKVVKKKAKKGE